MVFGKEKTTGRDGRARTAVGAGKAFGVSGKPKKATSALTPGKGAPQSDSQQDAAKKKNRFLLFHLIVFPLMSRKEPLEWLHLEEMPL